MKPILQQLRAACVGPHLTPERRQADRTPEDLTIQFRQ